MFEFIHSLLGVRHRAKLKGHYFLRNYKASHQDRVEGAISRAGLRGIIVVCDQAYGESGILPGKIAVFCRDDHRHAEPLFFQHYAAVKAEAKQQRFPRTRLA